MFIIHQYAIRDRYKTKQSCSIDFKMEGKMGDNKTIVEEFGYQEEIKELITMNDDIYINEELKKKVYDEANKNELLKITKVIGSTPIEITSVEIYDEEFLLNNF